MTRPPTLWLITDGKPGHENQSLGLAEAIARRVPCETHLISIADKRGHISRMRAALAASAGFPKPDLILAAGHATHPSLFWLARKHAGKSIVLMKPTLPVGWFDLCIAPSHDFPNGCSMENVILTRGAPNRIVASDCEKTGKLILIGGPSSSHGWDDDAILEMLSTATDRGGWELSDSRRTPGGFLEKVRTKLPGVTAFSHTETPPGWVPERLQKAKEVWVTEDSVSMIYEALTSGARVGLLPAPRLRKESRVLNGIDRLVTEGFLTPFPAWRKTGRLSDPPETLREADRCAELVLRRLGQPF